MQKDNLNLHVFQTETDVAQNLINDFFSNFDCQRYGGTRIISQKKQQLFMQNLTKEKKQPPVVTLQQEIF